LGLGSVRSDECVERIRPTIEDAAVLDDLTPILRARLSM